MAGAAESIKKAIALRESLVASANDTLDDRLRLARCYSNLSDLLSEPESMEYARKALEIHEALRAADPSNNKIMNEAGAGYHIMGQRFADAGDLAGALENWREMQEIYKALSESDPSNSMYRKSYALSCKRVGAVQIRTGELAAAEENYRRAIEMEEPLIAADPNNAANRFDFSYTLSDLGLILRQTKDYAGALQYYRRALAIREELSSADPKNVRARLALAITYYRIGYILKETGDYGSAVEPFRKSLQVREALLAADPTNNQYKKDVVDTHCWLASVHLAAASSANTRADDRAARWAEARAGYQRALDLWNVFIKQGVEPTNVDCPPEELNRQIANCEAGLRKSARQ
jgi:tetratricopeptide (TPR) repeat protein